LKRVGDWKNDKLDTRAEITQDKEVNFSENSDRSIQRKEDKTKNRVDSVAWVFAIILLCIAGFLIVRYGGLVGGLSLGVGITVFTATKNRVSSFVAFLSGVVSGLATYGIGSTAFVMMMEKM